MALDLNYTPEVFVEDITKLTEKEWLAYRKKGLGGSDIAAVFGVSPWRTARELWLDKRGMMEEPKKDNWVALEVGHRLEELVAQVFYAKTGLAPYAVRKMFRHPFHPFMLADVDFFVDLPDGRTFILECKTTSYYGKEHWGTDEEPSIPYHYELQGRHYMAVSNVDGVFFACLYDNNAESFIIREMERDLAAEENLIEQEEVFWNEYVRLGEEPPFTENPEMVLKAIDAQYRSRGGIKDLPDSLAAQAERFLEIKKEKNDMEAKVRRMERELSAIKAEVMAEMKDYEKGLIKGEGDLYECGFQKRIRVSVSRDNLTKMKMSHPEMFKEYAEEKESRIFFIKKKEA